jgi:hypothetical protein
VVLVDHGGGRESGDERELGKGEMRVRDGDPCGSRAHARHRR